MSVLSIRFTIQILLIVFLIGSPVTLAGSMENDIIDLEISFAEAVRAGGVGMEGLLHEDFFYNTINGTSVTKASLINSLGGREVIVSDLQRTCLRVDLFGNSAVVTAVSNAVFTMDGQESRLRSRYLHFWVRDDEQWQLFARQVTSIPESGANDDHCQN